MGRVSVPPPNLFSDVVVRRCAGKTYLHVKPRKVVKIAADIPPSIDGGGGIERGPSLFSEAL